MRFFEWAKDGGSNSPVDGFFLIEIKWLFSIVLLKFNKGGRENYHTHAFNALTWFLSGDLEEQDVSGDRYQYGQTILPKVTRKTKNHRVLARDNSWCFTIRGPWEDSWTEYNEVEDKTIHLTHGRREIIQT